MDIEFLSLIEVANIVHRYWSTHSSMVGQGDGIRSYKRGEDVEYRNISQLG